MLPYWSQDIDEISKQLGSTNSGLSQEEALQRLERFVPNQIQCEARVAPLHLFLNPFPNPPVLILVFAPHRWELNFIRRFMLVFGPLSSYFDLATSGALLWLMRASEKAFHTGWFIESVVSAAMVVLAVRTRRPVTRSRPGRAMLAATGG